MRRMLFKSLLHGPLTEAAPAADDAALAELAEKVDQAARLRLGRTLSIREVDAGSCNGGRRMERPRRKAVVPRGSDQKTNSGAAVDDFNLHDYRQPAVWLSEVQNVYTSQSSAAGGRSGGIFFVTGGSVRR